MDSYIIRIYRRHAGQVERIEGVVEKVGMKRRQTFHSVEELVAILTKKRLGKSQQSSITQSSTMDSQ